MAGIKASWVIISPPSPLSAIQVAVTTHFGVLVGVFVGVLVGVCVGVRVGVNVGL